MAKWSKPGNMENVDSGPGSKGSGGAAAPKMSSGDAGASSTEKTHNVEFAKGGNTPMFGEQQANPDKPGQTGKEDVDGKGAEYAKGGPTKMFGFSGALPATAGITSAR